MHDVEVLINAALIKLNAQFHKQAVVYLRDEEYVSLKSSKPETLTYVSDDVIHWQTPFAGPNHFLTIKHSKNQQTPVILGYRPDTKSDEIRLVPDPTALPSQ